jgi:two-component system response regulator DctR
MAEPTLYLVDDEAPVRDALLFLFDSFGVPVRSFAGGAALLEWLDAQRAPLHGCFLLDVRMEGMSGLALHDALIARRVRNPILFLTGHGDVAMAVDALKKGAFDFIEKPYSDSTLVERVRQALAVDAATRTHDARDTEARARLASLTPRERDVMRRVAAGKQNKVIADELHVSVRTIEVTRARVFSKLAVRSAAEVATLLATYGQSQGS